MTNPTPTPEEMPSLLVCPFCGHQNAHDLTGECVACPCPQELYRYAVEMQAKIAAQSQALAEREVERDELAQRIEFILTQFADFKAMAFDENGVGWKGRFAKLQRQRDERVATLTVALAEREERTDALWRTWKDEVGSLSEQIADLTARLTTTEKERDAACTLAQTTVDRVAELKAERDEARERIGALRDVLGRAATVIDRYGHFVRYGDLRHDISALLADTKPEGQQ